MKDFFKEMFDYTFHFNTEVLKLLEAQPEIPKKSLKLLNHTFNAHEIWNFRIIQKQPVVGVWNIRSFGELAGINTNNYNQTLEILDNYNLDEIVAYKNSRGESFENTIRDMLFHIVNHSTYHRGQIATDCKIHDVMPLVTDYIFYKRG